MSIPIDVYITPPSGIEITVDGPISGGGGGGGLDAEGVRDVMAATLVAGTNVTITENDPGNTITITSSGGGGGLTDEQVRDLVGATLVAGTNIAITVNDPGDTITIASTAVGGSATSNLQMVEWDTGTDAYVNVTPATGVKFRWFIGPDQYTGPSILGVIDLYTQVPELA